LSSTILCNSMSSVAN